MIFDNEQKRAINHLKGPLLLIAGPGSGKTTTMIERLATMINFHKINPKRILVITFSRAAASEMKNRFIKRMLPETYDVTFGTFHSIFLSMIKQYFGNKINFNLVTENTKKKYIESVLHEDGFDYILQDFIDEFLMDVTLYKNSNTELSSYLPISCDINMFMRIYSGYENLMLKNENMDFDDIIILMNDLLAHNSDFRSYWQNKFDYILIDEFQDINEQQFSAVCQLVKKHNNIFAVGDEDQSIYGFRGSKPEIMVNFTKVFNDSNIIYLTTNYRSGNDIVRIASNLIGNNKNRYKKVFKPKNNYDCSISVLKFKSKTEQIEKIIKIISVEKDSSIALLCRTNADKNFLKNNLKHYNKKISILTMHECKGLEFDFVWIINAIEGNCPFIHKIYGINIEEERRLFYVALTRARKKLYISYCKEYKMKFTKKSRFIKELRL